MARRKLLTFKVIGKRTPIKASFLQKIAWRSWRVVFTSDLPEDTDGRALKANIFWNALFMNFCMRP